MSESESRIHLVPKEEQKEIPTHYYQWDAYDSVEDSGNMGNEDS